MMDTPNTLNSGMCRCCSSEGTFKDIKTKYHWMGEEEVYADMLTDCFDIKIEIPEGMDNGICEVCITQLRNAANFKKQVLHTEEQFKRRLQNKDIKNPIKLESLDDSVGSDHLSDPDYSGNEYEVPIKEEIEEKPKAKKRSVQATTSRAKKPKTEPESSSQREPENALILTNEVDITEEEILALLKKQRAKPLSAKQQKLHVTEIKTKNTAVKIKQITEYDMQMHNLRTVMRCSNATPVKINRIWFFCCFCSDRYDDPADLKTHTMENHPDGRNASVGRTLNLLVIRMDITGLQCTICGTDMDSLEELMEHLSEIHTKRLHTQSRNYMVPFKFDSKEIRCTVCEMEFHNYYNLIQHMNTHYANFVCNQCGCGFINQRNLKLHVDRHAEENHKCSECKRVFGSRLKLHFHVKQIHKGMKKRYRCDFCDEMFSGFFMKNNHMVKEHGVAPPSAQCLECGKSFSSEKYLVTHQRTIHSGRHKCSECSKTFPFARNLQHHMLTHTGERDFECPICSKAFGRKNALREHLRIHANDRRFKCVHCGMAFVQKCSWRGHMRSKHGEEV